MLVYGSRLYAQILGDLRNGKTVVIVFYDTGTLTFGKLVFYCRSDKPFHSCNTRVLTAARCQIVVVGIIAFYAVAE